VIWSQARDYLLARLQEPGTLRSLVAVALGGGGVANATTTLDALVSAGVLLLGAVSAAMPERK